MNGECELGIYGLGVMGRNLLLNMADHGFRVAGYNRTPEKTALLRGAGENVRAFENIEEFLAALRPPRAVMLLVAAGPPVDAVIAEMLPRLAPGDCLVDGGNSFFKDTARRQIALAERGIFFLGAGVSGGEEGARHGPSLMPGGPREAWERVRPVFEAIAARADGEPCVGYLGPGPLGHLVKMVHNGIEYAAMALIAETYDLMKRGLGLTNDELSAVYERWNTTDLRGFLVEITARILRQPDEKTGGRLVDAILDVTRQKGTGRWTTQTALELGVPVPCIDTAVAMRDLSVLKAERAAAAALSPGAPFHVNGSMDALLEHLHGALYAGLLIAFAQGMALLRTAARDYGNGLDLATVARIWRGGCIIRAEILDAIAEAFRARPELRNLLLDPVLTRHLASRAGDLRAAVSTAASAGIPAPCLMAALGYYDSYRSARLPANLLEAQRDYFGAHGYERIGEEGTFHTEWSHE
ncbi:MAG: NADP-dependent phosphogluconate dehydrogenase [Chthoniobacteraceae bacterium]|nr:NADP-dependent phosphogluconate dehydrogenase [Chthoniobacteraceae bacterium]